MKLKIFSLFFVILLVCSTANALKFPNIFTIENSAIEREKLEASPDLIDLPPSLSFSSSTYNTQTVAVLTAVAVDAGTNAGIKWIKIYQDGVLLDEKNCNSLTTCTFSKTIIETMAITHTYYAVTEDLGSHQAISSTFSVVFAGQNQDPVITAYTPSSPITINENTQQIFTVDAYDPNNDPLTYTWRYDGVTVSTNAGSYTRNFDYFSSGSHVLSVTITDGYGGVAVRTWNINVANVLIPTTCTLDFNPLSPQTYGTLVTASCSCTSAIGPITETTAVLTRNTADVTLTENNIPTLLEAGTHDYVCYTTETANFAAAQDTDTYIINRADHNIHLALNGVEADLNGVYPFATNATGWLEITQAAGTAVLSRDGLQVATGSPATELANLPAGTYVYTYTYPQSQNYTAQAISRTLTIARATSTCSLTFDLASPQVYGTQITPTCTCTNPEAPAVLTVDGETITSGLAILLSAGNHIFNCSVAQTQNYTAAQVTANYTITQANPDLHLAINGNEMDMTYPYPTLTNTTAWTTATQGAIELYRNGILVANPEEATLDVGVYNYTAVYAATQNYTSATVTRFLTITSANAACTLTFDGNDVSAYAIDYNMPVNVVCTCTNPETNPTLYRDGVLMPSLSLIELLGAGTYNYVCNASATTNYVYAEDSGNLTVNPIAPVLTLTALPGWNVEFGTQTNVSCTANTPEVTPELLRDSVSVENPDIQTLMPGVYNYTCNSAATQNYTLATVSNILTVSNTRPSIILDFPIDNATIINNLTVDFGYTADDNEQTSLICNLFINESLADSTLVTSGVSHVVNYNFSDFGDYTWYVNCTDGALTATSEIRTLHLVNTTNPAPTIVLNSPANATLFPAGTTIVTLNWTSADDGTSVTDIVYVDSGSGFAAVYSQTHAPGTYTYNLTVADGTTYRWYVTTNDGTTLVTSATWTFAVNTTTPNTAPWIILNAPANDTTINDNLVVDFNYTAFDNEQSSLNCNLYVESAAHNNIVTNATSQIVQHTFAAFGDYTWYVNCTDGALTATSEIRTLHLVNTTNPAPTIVLNSPANATLFPAGTTIVTLNWTSADDGTSVTDIVYVDSGSGFAAVYSQTHAPGTYTYNLTVADGTTYRWYVTTNDGTTLVTSATWTFAVNTTTPNTAPIVTLNSPLNNSQINNTNTVVFNFTATDDLNTSLLCSLYLDGALNQTITALNNTATTITINNITYGAHNWYVICNDGSLTGTSATWYFNLNDTIAPIVTIVSPANGQTYVTTSVPLQYTLSEPAVWCAYSLDGSANTTLNSCANTTLTGLTQGQHTVIVYARDLYGNTGSATSTFRINLTGTVQGHIYNTTSGNALEGATVQLRSGALIVAQTTSAVDGTYGLTAAAGNYNLSVSKAGFTDVSVPVTIVATLTTYQDVVLQPVVTQGNLNGYVNDSNNYLYGATVQLKLGNVTLYTTTTDANGYYSIANIQQDTYTIVVSKSGFNTNTNTITINGGATAQRNVTLTAASNSGRITGTVYENVTYTPVANATVYIWETGTSNLIQVAKTAANGNYVVNGLVTSIGYDLNATKLPEYTVTIWPAIGVYVPAGGTNSGNGIIIG